MLSDRQSDQSAALHNRKTQVYRIYLPIIPTPIIRGTFYEENNLDKRFLFSNQDTCHPTKAYQKEGFLAATRPLENWKLGKVPLSPT